MTTPLVFSTKIARKTFLTIDEYPKIYFSSLRASKEPHFKKYTVVFQDEEFSFEAAFSEKESEREGRISPENLDVSGMKGVALGEKESDQRLLTFVLNEKDKKLYQDQSFFHEKITELSKLIFTESEIATLDLFTDIPLDHASLESNKFYAQCSSKEGVKRFCLFHFSKKLVVALVDSTKGEESHFILSLRRVK